MRSASDRVDEVVTGGSSRIGCPTTPRGGFAGRHLAAIRGGINGGGKWMPVAWAQKDFEMGWRSDRETEGVDEAF
jgi:hypothetical protein